MKNASPPPVATPTGPHPDRARRMVDHQRPRPAVHHATFLIAAALVGCQSYRPRPLDLDSTRDAWLSRSPSDARALADRLFATEAAPTNFDLTDGISLHEAEAIALVFNRDLRVARLDAGVALATADYAGLWQDPVLGIDTERIISGVPDPWVVGATIGLTIPISGRLALERDLAHADADAALFRIAALEWSVRCDLRRRWVEWSAHAERRRLASTLIDRLAVVVDLAARQAEAGVITALDAHILHVELAGASADLLAADARAREAELSLRDILGLSPAAPLHLLELVAWTPRHASHDDARTLLERTSPALAVASAEHTIAERTLRLEIREQYPDLEIGLGGASDEGTDRVLMGVSLPVPVWNRNRQAIAEAVARREAARVRFESAYEHAATRLAAAWDQWTAQAELRNAIQTDLLPSAELQDRDARRIAQLGRVETLVLLQSIQVSHNARLRLLDAIVAESLAAISIDEAVGPPPTNPPPSPAPPTPNPGTQP